MSGHGGINKFGGQFEHSSHGQLRFHRIFATRRAGPPEMMAIEAAYLSALNKTRSCRLEGTSLLLLDSAGRILVHLTALTSE